jgi:hypothetical protein
VNAANLFAEIDAWRWFKAHGALAAALGAAAGAWGAVWASWYAARGSRTTQRETREHELRRPIYLAFARSVSELETESSVQWEHQYGGPGLEWNRTNPPLLDDCAREVMRHLADVEMAGPPEVSEKARALRKAVFDYWRAHLNPQGGPFAQGDLQAKFDTAFEEFSAASRKALGLRE